MDLVFGFEGKFLVSAAYDGTARVWLVKAGTCENVIGGHGNQLNGVALGVDGRTVATAGSDGNVGLWRRLDEERLDTLRGHTGEVSAVAFSPKSDNMRAGALSRDGLTAVVGDDKGRLRIYRLGGANQRPTMLVEYRHGTDRLRALAFSADGSHVASASADKRVLIWRVPK